MLRIITINEEGGFNMEITNKSIKTGEEQESQTIEWKWTWQEDYLKWLCGYANTDGGVLNIGVNDDGYVVGIEESKKMLEALPNKINDKLGILASVQIHSVYGAENIRYGANVPEGVADKLINQYATGAVNTDTLPVDDKNTGLWLRFLKKIGFGKIQLDIENIFPLRLLSIRLLFLVRVNITRDLVRHYMNLMDLSYRIFS